MLHLRSCSDGNIFHQLLQHHVDLLLMQALRQADMVQMGYECCASCLSKLDAYSSHVVVRSQTLGPADRSLLSLPRCSFSTDALNSSNVFAVITRLLGLRKGIDRQCSTVGQAR